MIANYHTHTPRCGHAKGSEREYIEQAISLGFRELGFSEHAPMPFPDNIPEENLNRLLAMRMKIHEIDEYVNTLLTLREEYKNDIKLHIGFEVEYFPCCYDRFLESIADYPIDYLILGQHFEDPTVSPMRYFGSPYFHDDAILKQYVDLAVAAIESERITYVAHPDLPMYRHTLDAYDREMSRLIRSANAHKVPLEINFYGLQEIRNYPTLAFWQIAAEIGCDVVLGSDAHMPKNLMHPLAYRYAMQLVNAFPGLHLLDTVQFKPLK